MEKTSRNIMLFETEKISKAITVLALPTMIAQVIQLLYNLVDTYFIGQTGDADQLSAVALISPIVILMTFFSSIFGVGGGTAISRNLGAKNYQRAKYVSSFCYYGSLLLGLLVIALGLIFKNEILDILGAADNTLRFADEYFTYIIISAPLAIGMTTCAYLLRSEGEPTIVMIGYIIGTVLKLIFDPLLINTAGLGCAGAAIATIIAYFVMIVFYSLFIARKSTNLSLKIKDFKIKYRIPGEVLSIGGPSSLQHLLSSVCNILLNNALLFYGSDYVAAYGTAVRVCVFGISLEMGIALGAQPFWGYNFGAKNYKRMKASMKFTLIISAAFGLVICLLYEIFPGQILGFFTPNENVISLGIPVVRALMFSGAFLSVYFVCTFAMQAMGQVIPSLFMSVCRQGLIYIPAMYALRSLFGLNGIIVTQPFSDILSVVCAAVMYYFVNKNVMARLESKALNEQRAGS